jgi:ketosteroid isomerase-like protein
VSDQRSPDEDVAWRWAEAVNRRDVDALVELSQPDIDCYTLQIAVSGHYKGHDGLRRWMDELTTDDIGHGVNLERVRTLGDGRIAVFGNVCLEGTLISPYSLILTMRDGLAAAARSYLSDEQTLEHLKLIA